MRKGWGFTLETGADIRNWLNGAGDHQQILDIRSSGEAEMREEITKKIEILVILVRPIWERKSPKNIRNIRNSGETDLRGNQQPEILQAQQNHITTVAPKEEREIQIQIHIQMQISAGGPHTQILQPRYVLLVVICDCLWAKLAWSGCWVERLTYKPPSMIFWSEEELKIHILQKCVRSRQGSLSDTTAISE